MTTTLIADQKIERKNSIVGILLQERFSDSGPDVLGAIVINKTDDPIAEYNDKLKDKAQDMFELLLHIRGTLYRLSDLNRDQNYELGAIDDIFKEVFSVDVVDHCQVSNHCQKSPTKPVKP